MKKIYTAFLLFAFTVSAVQAQNFSTRVLADSLFIPWEMVYGLDNHIWFTQKNGHVCRLNPDNDQLDTILSVPENVVHSEGGMMGLAIEFTAIEDVHLYLAYQYLDGSDYFLIVKRFNYHTLNQSIIEEDTLIDRIPGANIHNGCRLLLDEGKLFMTTGDAADPAQAQDLNALNGKILRLNLDGTVPADNPIPGSPLWSWGHRNPQGLLKLNNKLYSSEHGPDSDDEINIIQAGRNYGWPGVRGYCDLPAEQQFCNDSAVVEPIQIWTPTIAPSDMIFYDGPMFPGWNGSLLMATLKNQQLMKLELNAMGDSILNAEPIQGIQFGRLRDVCMAPDGRLFLSTSNSQSGGEGAYEDKIIEIYQDDNGLGNMSDDQHELRLYPNPTGSRLYVFSEQEESIRLKWEYRLLDITGRQVAQGLFNYPEIAVNELLPGIYLLQLHSPEKKRILTGRFIKK